MLKNKRIIFVKQPKIIVIFIYYWCEVSQRVNKKYWIQLRWIITTININSDRDISNNTVIKVCH